LLLGVVCGCSRKPDADDAAFLCALSDAQTSLHALRALEQRDTNETARVLQVKVCQSIRFLPAYRDSTSLTDEQRLEAVRAGRNVLDWLEESFSSVDRNLSHNCLLGLADLLDSPGDRKRIELLRQRWDNDRSNQALHGD